MKSWVYKQGESQGRAEGLESGRLSALRESIEVALTTRGLRLTTARRSQLEAETRVEVLQRWLARSITAPRIADVFANDAS